MSHQVFTVITQQDLGVLQRIIGAFTRRGLKLNSLSVQSVVVPDCLHVVVHVAVDREQAQQIVKQLGECVTVMGAYLGESRVAALPVPPHPGQVTFPAAVTM